MGHGNDVLDNALLEQSVPFLSDANLLSQHLQEQNWTMEIKYKNS